ncbi:MAG: peptidase domain-containing ABC transporter [Thermoanaerobaculia bacterium]
MAEARSHLAERFPALAALGLGRRRKLPFVAQTAATDCAAACLAMCLGYHGKVVSLDEVRQVTGLARHGTDARTLLAAARHFGLRGRGVQLAGPRDLPLLEAGAILHWGFNHFVVLERSSRKGAWVVDPGFGPRFVPRAELDRVLTGVAVVLEPGEAFTEGGERKPLLRRYLGRVLGHRQLLSRVLSTSLVLQGLALALPLLTGILIDRVIPRGDRTLLWVLLAGAAALVAFQLLAALVRGHLLLALRTRLDSELTLDFLDHLVHLPFLYFQKRSAGDLLMRLASNSAIREILTSAVLSTALDGLMVASYLVLLLAADWRLGLLVALLAALRLAILLGALARRKLLTSQALEAQAASQSYQVQLLAGIEAIKACGSEDGAVEAWSHLFVRELNVSLARGRLDTWVASLLEALALGSPIAVLLYGGLRVMAGDLSLGTMLSLAALAGGFLAPLSTLVANATQFQLLGSYLDRLEDVLATAREPMGAELARPASFAGAISLAGVSFRYGPLVPPAVEGVTVDIRPGELVALVGFSGSGKSTLAGLLAGLIHPEGGQVLYDGRPLSQLPAEWLRKRLAYVPQRSYLFASTVRANIALADPALPMARVVEAARLAEIDEEISALPMGYETVLADGGSSLSGGQQQRIALARALVGRPRVLILDEATSALDTVTERKIQHNLGELSATRIVAAHRLSTIRHADRILVLDAGRLVDSGTHEELLSRPGVYRRLVAAQLESPEPASPRVESRPLEVVR